MITDRALCIETPKADLLDRIAREEPDLGLEGDQAAYASRSLRQWLDETRADREAGRLVPFLLRSGEKTVGFFALGLDPQQIAGYAPKARDAVLLRNFFVVRNEQGHGIAAKALAALPALVRRRWPDRRWIYLVVNFRNTVAKRVYLRAGWVDTCDVWLKGTAGPAHVYARPVERSCV